MALDARVSPAPVARLKRGLIGLVVGVGLGGLVGLYLASQHISLPSFRQSPEEKPPTGPLQLPDALTKDVPTYTAPKAIQAPPKATPLPAEPPKPAGAPVQTQSQPGLADLPGFLQLAPPPAPPATAVPRQAPPVLPQGVPWSPETTASGRQSPQAKPKRTALFLQPSDGNLKKPEGAPSDLPKEVQEALKQAPTNAAANIIKPATWAIPVRPDLTLYRSMILPGRLVDAINSDIPASTIRVETTVPIFDKITGQRLLLDKGTIIIISQVGKAEYGQERIPVKVEQIELKNGVVLELKATGGDANRANGIPAHVNNHLGKLLLSTGINAVLQLGLGAAAGTPSGFQPSPAQQAARDAGQSLAQDINSVTRQQLRVPPTLDQSPGAIVTIALGENVQLNRKPYVAK